MYAQLPESSHRRRWVGAAATLAALALLAFALSRPIRLTSAEREPELILVMDIERDIAPDVRPIIPQQTIDLPTPKVMVNLPDFENPTAPPALTSPAPVFSADASPASSGSDTVLGEPDGAGRSDGSGAKVDDAGLVPPVRLGGTGMPFDLKSASRAGLVTSLNFCVTEDGRTRHVQLAASSGFSDMDTIAIDWLAQQQFTPGTLDGARARMCGTYDIRWSYSKATSFESRDAAKAHAETIRRRSRYPRQFVYWPEDRPFPGCDAVSICRTNVE